VVTGNDIPGLYGPVVQDRPVLAQSVVRFTGEPVAAVAAMSKEIARQALDLIEVEYEPLKPVFKPEEAMAPSAPVLHEGLMGYEKKPPLFPWPAPTSAAISRSERETWRKALGNLITYLKKRMRCPAITMPVWRRTQS